LLLTINKHSSSSKPAAVGSSHTLGSLLSGTIEENQSLSSSNQNSMQAGITSSTLETRIAYRLRLVIKYLFFTLPLALAQYLIPTDWISIPPILFLLMTPHCSSRSIGEMPLMQVNHFTSREISTISKPGSVHGSALDQV
jgi:hypothetical protein